MAPDSQTRKILFLLVTFALTISAVFAAEIDLNDDIVWLNGDNNQQEATFSKLSSNDYNLEISNDSFDGEEDTATPYDIKEINDQDPNVSTDEVISSGNLKVGKYEFLLRDSSDVITSREPVYLKSLNVEDQDDGSGFVGKNLGEVQETEPLNFNVTLESQDIKKSNLKNFNIDSDKASLNGNIEKIGEGDEVKVVAQPKINEQLNEGQSLKLTFEYVLNNSAVEKAVEFTPTVYELRAVPSGDRPPIELEYGNIQDYSYNLDIYKNGDDVSNTEVRLFDENFELEIDGIRGSNFDGDDEDLLDVEAIDNENADYRITLDRIPQLSAGTYRFTVHLVQNDEQKAYVDDIRVSNNLKLSGRVQDSRDSAVQARFNLRQGDTEIPIKTDDTGNYYKEISSDKNLEGYQVDMEFFDLGTFSGSSDAEITVEGVDFEAGENENIAGDEESIKFQYWQSPPVEQKAINPVNMMAAKFAYPMAETGHFASMKFNPAKVNPEEVRVYGCDAWNFERRICSGNWNEVSGVNIDYQGSRAEFNIDDPYLAEDTGDGDQNILMNAYIVGTSTGLNLDGKLGISSPQYSDINIEEVGVPTGSDIEVNGRIMAPGGSVEGANVDISFYRGETKIKSLDEVETGPEGRFSATGRAPEEVNNYSIKLNANADNYERLERKISNHFETFVDIGVEVDSSMEVNPGEEKKTEITVQNIGKTTMDNVDITIDTTLDPSNYQISEIGTITEEQEEKTVELTVSLPSDYCDDGCGDWPSLEVSATATNPDGEEFEADAETLQVQINRLSDQNDSEESDQETSETSEANNSDSGFTQSVSDLENATGEFIASQSSLNLALGLIMVFMMVLAGAVKKQDNGSGRSSGSRGDRDGRGGRPRVQKPDVGGSSEVKQVETDQEVDEVDNVVDQIESDDQNVDSQIDAIAGSVVGEEQEDTKVVEVEDKDQDSGSESTTQETLESEEVDGEEKFVCEETGEEFDTKAALKLHRQINGLDN